MKTLLLSIAISITSILSLVAQPTVTQKYPEENSTRYSVSSSVLVYFSEAMNTSTFTSNSVKLFGSSGKIYTGAITSGSTYVRLNPDDDFLPGEKITFLLTTDVESAGAVALANPFTYSFHIQTADSGVYYDGVTTYGAGTTVSGAAIADVNNDGHPDLISANNGSDNVSVLINDGNGAFASAVNYAAASGTYKVASGDFNADGHVDIAAVNQSANNVSIFINDQDGTFATAVNYSAGTTPRGVEVTDLDGDGDLDLAITANYDDSVAVLANNGSGVFGSPTKFRVPDGPIGLTTADVDKDGLQDIIVASIGADSVSVIRSFDGVQFYAAVTYLVGNSPYAVEAADFDGDGWIDLVATNKDDNNVSVLINNGDGTFGSATNYSVQGDPRYSAVSDMNGDQHLDIVTANYGSSSASVLVNDGDGTFATAVNYGITGSPHHVVLGDLDGDRDIEIVTGNYQNSTLAVVSFEYGAQITGFSPSRNAINISASSNITVTFDSDMDQTTLTTDNIVVTGSFRGTYGGAITYDSGSKTATYNPTNDFRAGELITVSFGDGIEDSEDQKLLDPESYSFTVSAEGDGDFGYPRGYTTFASNSVLSSVAADLDNDGDIDFASITPTSNYLTVFRNNGDGTFATGVDYPSVGFSATKSVTSADINGDGYMDIITGNNLSDGISIFLNNGTGDASLAAKTDLSTTYGVTDVKATDFDLDGDLDLIASTNGPRILIHLNQGSGTFAAQVEYITNTGGLNSIFIADMDNDGWPDVVSAHGSIDSVYVHNNNKNGSLGGGRTLKKSVTYPHHVIAGNFDNNQVLDVLVTNRDTDDVKEFSSNGTVSMFDEQTISVGDTPGGLQSGDYDGDGDLDVLVANKNDGTFSVLVNSGSGGYTVSTFTTGGNPNDIAIADFDGDNKMDVITSNTDGTVSVLLNGSEGPFEVSSVTPGNGAKAASISSNIEIKFNEGVNSSTLTSTNIKIRGSMTGLLDGAFSYSSGDSTATFNPTSDFEYGERIDMVITTGVENEFGYNLNRNYTASFTVATIADNGGVFSVKTDYNAGNGARDVALFDIDGDSDLDVLTINFDADSLAVIKNSGDGTFVAPVYYYVGNEPTSFAIGDVTGDGNPDVVSVANESAFSVLEGNGDGTFNARTTKSISSAASDISLTDIDLDGDLDVVYSKGTQIERQLNDGSANFSSTYSYGTGEIDVYTIDVDSDWDIDFISANQNAGLSTLNLSYTDSTGNSTGGNSYSSAVNPTSVAAGDFDNDGDVDIVTSNLGSGNGSFSYFANNGNGTFATKVDYTIGSSSENPQDLVATDVDGDGDLDVIIANTDHDNIILYTNDGSATFTKAGEFTTGDSPYAIAFGDVDNDGTVDAVTANSVDDNISVLTGATPLELSSFTPSRHNNAVAANSNITFTFNQDIDEATATTSNIKAIGSISGSIAGAFSFDTGSDVLTFNPTNNFIGGEQIDVTITTSVTSSAGAALTGREDWSFRTGATGGEIFTTVSSQNQSGANESGIRFVDMDNDGDADLVSGNNLEVMVLLNDGSGNYSYSDTTKIPAKARAITVADFNQDGYMDVAVTADGTDAYVSVLINNQANSFEQAVSYTFTEAYPRGIDAGDIDQDGYPDIVATMFGSDAIRYLKNDGDGTFTAQSNITVGDGPYLTVELIDVDSDGDLDIVSSDWNAQDISVAKNNGDGSFAAASSYSITQNYPGKFTSGDIDGDGDIDIIAGQTDSSEDLVSGMTVFINDGNGDFSTTSNISGKANGLKLFDMDGDGDLDLSYVDYYGAQVGLYLNNGSGTFTASSYPASFGSSLYAYDVDAADMDADGDIDLAVAEYYDVVYTLENGDLVEVSSITPSNNLVDISASGNITVTFNTNMDAATFADTSVVVTGSESGILGKSLTLNNSTLTIDPTNNFLPGEEITVTVTNDLKSTSGSNLYTSVSNSYTVAASGNGYFTYRDTLPLSSTYYNGNYQVDVDKDGDIDVLNYEINVDSLVVYKNNGAGIFSRGNALYIQNFESLKFGDIDGDGDMDFTYQESGLSTHYFGINDGSGIFMKSGTSVSTSSPATNRGYILKDIDGNGFPDLIYATGNSYIYVRYNDNGTFGNAKTFLPGDSPDFMAAGDIDNDGDIDVLVTTGSKVYVMENSGGQSLGENGPAYATTTTMDEIQVKDLNADGYPDIIVMEDDADYSFEILMNDGDGTFANAVNYALSADYRLYNFDSGDIDGDGDLDLVFMLENDTQSTDHYLLAYNNGSGGFGNQIIMDIPDDAPYNYYGLDQNIFLNDMDGDSELDIVTILSDGSKDYIAFFENSSLTSTTPSTQITSLAVDSKTHTAATFSWTKGDGARRLIVIKEASSVTQNPSDNGNYSADTDFGSGSNIGDNTYVVYAGAFLKVTVTGLSSNTEYTVKAFEMNGLKGSESILLTSAPAVTFTTNPPPTIWAMDADSLVFTKSDNADFTLSSNYDKITPQVWLTRGLKRSLFNIKTESAYDDDNHSSPEGTKWALGTTSDGVENLTFDTFYNTLSSNVGDNVVNANMVMYIEEEDLYIDIVFRSWTQGGGSNQGGFSYTRATGDAAIANPTINPDADAGSTVVFNGSTSKVEIKTNVFVSPEGVSSGGGGGGEEFKTRGSGGQLQDIGLTSDFTFEMWVKPANSSYVGGFLVFEYASSAGKVAPYSEPFIIGVNNGKFYASAYDESTNIDSTITGTAAVSSNQWYHVAVTFDYDYSTDGFTMKMFVNGTQDGPSRKIGDFYTSRDGIWLGYDETNYFEGEIDEFRIWRTARTADSLRTYMHRTINNYNEDLLGYWQFNEGSGSTATDVMTSEEATLTNVTWTDSEIPIGNGTTNSSSSITSGDNTIGNAKITLTDDFESAVDIYVSEVESEPNTFPNGYTAGIGGKYFVIELFGDPGTFSANVTLNFGAANVTADHQSNPSQLKLYKREGTSSGSWTSLGGATSANDGNGEVTWTGITSFSQFMAVEGDPYDLIQLADNSDAVAYDDSVFVFGSTFFDLNDNYADTALTISSNTTLTGKLFIDKNANNSYDDGTDEQLTSGAERTYTPSGSEKLIYSSSALGYESATITLKSTNYTDSVPLELLTVEGSPTISGTDNENAWQLITNPFTTTIGTMLDSIWTQGAINSDAPNGQATIYSYTSETSEFKEITTDLDTTKVRAGDGLAVYMFAFNDYAAGIPADGGWPKTLRNYGTPHGTSVGLTLKNVDHDETTGTSGDEGWVLVGNPFGWALSADSVIASIKRDDASANSYLYRWDVSTNNYTFFSTGAVQPYESVFARLETSGVTANITLDQDDRHASGSKEVSKEFFALQLTHPETGMTSAFFLDVDEKRSAGIDTYDAYYRSSLAAEYANIYGKTGDQRLVLNALPVSLDEELEIPLHLDATVSGSFSLNWNAEMIPEGWELLLRDETTGKNISLNESDMLSFTTKGKLSKKQHFVSALTASSDGKPRFTLIVRSDIITSLEEVAGIPTEVELYQNYPNPFNPSTVIKFGVPEVTNVRLEVFDLLGRRVKLLMNNETKPAGRYTVPFNARDLASGIYFYRLTAGQKIMMKQMTLIK